MTAPAPYPAHVGIRAVAHGLDAAQVQLRRDDVNGAAYIELDGEGLMSIRVQLRPHSTSEPGKHAATLEQSREGLRRLAALATRLAQEIEQREPSEAAGELGQLPGPGGDEDQAAEDGAS